MLRDRRPDPVSHRYGAYAPNSNWNRGASMATNGIPLRTGRAMGPLLMAFLAGTLGLTGAYLASAGVALAAFVWQGGDAHGP